MKNIEREVRYKVNNKKKTKQTLSIMLAATMLIPSITPVITNASSGGGTRGSITMMRSPEAGVSIEDKIPDENLKKEIREQLGVSVITKENILNLKIFDLSLRHNVKSLEGIEYAENLEFLNLYMNGVNNFEPIRNLIKLKELNIGFHGLKDLEIIKNLKNLEKLHIHQNHFENLDMLKNFPKLKKLSAYGNYITNINYLKNLNLEEKDLSGQNLKQNMYKRSIDLIEISNNPKFIKSNSTDKYKIVGNTVVLDDDYVGKEIKVNFTTDDIGKDYYGVDKPELGFSGTITINTSNVKPAESNTFSPTFKTDTVRVKKGESVDLKARLTNKPSDATVTVVKNIDTNTAGTKTGRIKIKFGDGTSKEYDLIVKVELKTDAELFTPKFVTDPVRVAPNEKVDISGRIENLPEGAKSTQTQAIDTSTAGIKEGKVKVTFKDGSSKEYTLQVPVEIKKQSEYWQPEISKDKVRVKPNEKVDLTTRITNLPAGAKIVETQPIETATTGEKIGKVKITFSDGSEKEYGVTVDLEIKKQAEYYEPQFVEEKLRVIPNEKVDLTKRLINKPEGAEVTETQPITTDSTGMKTGKIKVTFSDKSEKEYEVKVNLEIKKQAEYFNPEINQEPLKVVQGEEVDLKDRITNLSEGAVVETLVPVDTQTEGEKVGQVKITFADGSEQTYEIPVNVVFKTGAEAFQPQFNQDPLQVVKGEKIDLTKRLLNLPEGATVEEIESVDSMVDGEKIGKIKVTFPDGSEAEYEVKVVVEVKTYAEVFKPQFNQDPVQVNQGDKVDLTQQLLNKPEGAVVEEIQPIDTLTEGEKTGKIKVTFPDASVQEYEVKVNITYKPVVPEEKPQSETFKPQYPTTPIKVNKGDKVDLTNILLNKPEGAEVQEVMPIDTTEAGQKVGQIRIMFEDGSVGEYTVEINIEFNQEEKPNIIPNIIPSYEPKERPDNSSIFNNYRIPNDNSTEKLNLKTELDLVKELEEIKASITEEKARIRKELREQMANDKYFREEAKSYWLFKIGDLNYKFITPTEKTNHTADLAPFIVNNKTMMPFRYVGYALNVDVEYDNTLREAIFTKGNNTLRINIDTKKATMNGQSFKLEVEPMLTQDRLVAPLSEVGRAFGKTVGLFGEDNKSDIIWNQSTQEVVIYNYK